MSRSTYSILHLCPTSFVSSFVSVLLRVCPTPCCPTPHVSHPKCVPLRVCPTSPVSYSASVPLRTCPTPRVSHSVCVSLRMCTTPCVSYSKYPTPCVLLHVSYSICPTPYILLGGSTQCAHSVRSTPCLFHSMSLPLRVWSDRNDLAGAKRTEGAAGAHVSSSPQPSTCFSDPARDNRNVTSAGVLLPPHLPTYFNDPAKQLFGAAVRMSGLILRT